MKQQSIFQFALFLILMINIMTLSAQKVPSQNPNYGPDSLSRITCANELSTLAEYMKINLPEYALPSWRNVFENCPASSKNIYIYGAKIFQGKIEKAQDTDLQSAYFDTLMLIYDRRIEYFGEEGQVLARKGKDMLRYRSQDYDKAYNILKLSMEKSGSDVDPVVLVGVIETGVMMFREGKITAKELLDNYLSVSELTENQLNSGGRPERSEQIFSRINAALVKAGLTNCNEIVEAFQSKLVTDSSNSRTLNLISELIITSGCENSDFFGAVNEKLYIIEPTSDRAYSLAWFNIRKEKFETAIYYLKEAIEIESDSQKKSHYYYQMALIYNTKMNLQQEAVSSATQALNLQPNWGEPYFVIASAYLLGSKDCFDGAFERSTVYWVAVDKCNNAKSIDKSVENKANGLIADYIRFFPNTEEIFFRAFQEGSEYTVGCWINEKTTVRARK